MDIFDLDEKKFAPQVEVYAALDAGGKSNSRLFCSNQILTPHPTLLAGEEFLGAKLGGEGRK